MKPIYKKLKQQKAIDIYFLVIALVGVLLTLSASYDFSYTIFADRLLLRASNIFNNPQTMGPELTYEGRIPGGMFYYIMGFLFSPFSSPLILNSILIGLHIASGIYLCNHVLKYTNKTTACITAAFYFSQHLLAPEILYIWNPSLAPFFAIFIFKGVTDIFIDDKKSSCIWLLPVIGVAAQVHLSFLTLFFTFIILSLINRKRLGTLYPSLGILLFILTYLPYIYSEITSGFLNTKLLSKSALNVNDYKNIKHYFLDLTEHLPLYLGGVQSGWENRVPSGNFLNSIKYFFAIPLTLLVFFRAGFYFFKTTTPDERLVKLCSRVLLISTFILIFSMTPIRSRRVLFLLPYLLLIISFSLSSFLKNPNNKFKKTALVSLTAPFFIFHLACFSYEININTRRPYNNRPSLFFSYRDFLEVVELAKSHQVTRSEFRYGLTYIDKKEKWLWTSFKDNSVYNVTRFSIDYLANWKYETKAFRARPLKSCYFFTRNKYLTNKDLAQKNHNLKDFNFVDRPAQYLGSSFNFSLFTYHSWNGNCVRRVNNRYNPTQQEVLLSKLKHSKLKKAPTGTAFSALDIEHSTELSFLVTAQRVDNDTFTLGLHSPELRGYDGPSRYWLKSPKIVLVHKETKKKYDVKFFPSEIQSPVRMHTYWDMYDSHNLMLTPFWAHQLKLQKGEYSVELVAESLRFGYFAYFGAGLLGPFRHLFKTPLHID